MELQNELNRLRNEASLKLPLYHGYLTNHFTIYYHNVISLLSKRKNIINDPLYENHDLIFIGESNVKDGQEVSLPGMKKSFRLKCSEQVNFDSVICFSKVDFTILATRCSERNGKKICLVLIFVQGIYLITGYISPKYRLCLIKFNFQKLFPLIPKNSQLVVIGDFNLNLKDSAKKSVLDSLFQPFSLQSVLPVGMNTTIHGSHLDTIYTNLSSLHANRFTSYYSDHFPIYIQIPIS